MTSSTIRKIVRYGGHVQGVGFRMTAISQGRGLNLHGFVRNEPDGSVLMDVEGPTRDVKELLRRIDLEMNQRIDAAEVDERPVRGVEGGFRIEY